MAAFRYPHRTRPNSGPDQIILVMKISTEPIRSWCCLHIHAKFWSAAAVDNSGPISVSQCMSQQCLQTMCVFQTTFSRFHFIFLYLWITKRRKLAHHKFRFSRKKGGVFWDTFPRGVRISTKNNALEEQGLSFFFSNISDHFKLRILIIIQISSSDQFAPCCRFSIFVATLTFPAKCQRFGLVRWAGSV